MKKIFGISLVAVLAAMPMIASAANVDKNPTHESGTAAIASDAPKYQLASANDSYDGKVATAGYVKGAYNAAIKGINRLDSKIDTLQGQVESAQGVVQEAATKAGVVATINNATSSSTFSGAEVNGSFSGAEVNGYVSGTASGNLSAMSEWGETTTSPIAMSATFNSAALTGTASGTMSGTAEGELSGTVAVTTYTE